MDKELQSEFDEFKKEILQGLGQEVEKRGDKIISNLQERLKPIKNFANTLGEISEDLKRFSEKHSK